MAPSRLRHSRGLRGPAQHYFSRGGRRSAGFRRAPFRKNQPGPWEQYLPPHKGGTPHLWTPETAAEQLNARKNRARSASGEPRPFEMFAPRGQCLRDIFPRPDPKSAGPRPSNTLSMVFFGPVAPFPSNVAAVASLFSIHWAQYGESSNSLPSPLLPEVFSNWPFRTIWIANAIAAPFAYTSEQPE